MEKKSLLKKLIFCLCIGFFAAVFAVPVQAAVYKKAQTKVIRAGECYHLIGSRLCIGRERKGIKKLQQRKAI